jgi:DNA polymerase III epsilon subunit family exonuclease
MDGARRPVKPANPSDGRLRRWLHVPRHLGLPAWARQRLGEPVDAERRAREGLASGRAVFGVIDLETTGLASRSCSILEIGLVVQRGGRVLERFETFVEPGAPVPWRITELTGIHPAMLEGAPDVCEAMATLAKLLEAHRVDALVAHNAPFDRSFLEPAWTQSGQAGELPPFLCSLRLARRLVGAPSYGLGTLVEHLSIPRSARHRALGDAEMTAFLWWELLGRARLEGVHTVEALAGLASPRRGGVRKPRVRTVDAPGGIG